MRFTGFRTLTALALTCGLLIGNVHAGAAAPTRAMTSISLQLKWLPQAQFAGYYVALKKGYYAREGLDMKILPGGPTITPEQVVANGGADFGLDWLPSLLVERENGENLVNIAQIYQTSGMRLISFKSQHITSFQDLKDKTVGVWFAGNQYQFLACMNKLSIDTNKDMNLIHQGFDMNAFLSHQLQAASAMTYNELGVVLESGVKLSDLNVLNYSQCGVSQLEDGLYARADYLKAHRDVTIRFLRASIRGWQDAIKDPSGAAKIVFGYDTSGTMKLAHQVYMAKEVAKLINYGPAIKMGIGYMNPVAYKTTVQDLLVDKVIKKAPSGAYDQSYWKVAISTLNQ
jgi:NitT/TauT family transport system substrate-binding protein